MKRLLLSTLMISPLIFGGCDNSVSVNGGSMSSTDGGRGMGSLSGEEDLQTLLTAKNWHHIQIDLDIYKYDRSSTPKTYDIDMTFTKNRVSGVANCQRFSANYKAKDDELIFSKVHFEPASDLATCKESPKADEALNTFFSDSYTLSGTTGNKITLSSENYETSATLSY